jgi:hypothetical protein
MLGILNKVDMNPQYPRVLIISHNALSDTQSNGKTLSAFFSKWDKDKLAQIYLTTDVPDFSVCNKFFQINDIDILKRAFFCKQVQGRLVACSELSEMKTLKSEITHNPIFKLVRSNISPLFRLLRDLLWDIAGYKTREMKKFIDDFNPDIVFFQSSSGVFAFSLTKWVCRYRNIPLVMQTTDDYVSGMFTFDPFFWIQLIRVKQAYKWAVFYSDWIVAIGDKMAEEYKLRFGGNYFVAMNSISDLNLPKYTPINKIINFIYAGNLGLNRWKVIALIADCLKDLQNEEGLNGQLSIYSLVEPGTKELSFLNNPPVSSYKGALNTDELNSTKIRSDVLVHVEAFDRINRHVTRLSISTKIPEYLASGRCILAVGPEDVASMQYLAEYGLGVTVMSDRKSEIKKALKEIMINSETRTRYAEKGVGVARLRHNADKTAESIFQIITSTISKHSSTTE